MREREKNAQVAFRLTDELARRFRVACAWKGTKLQTFLEQAVQEFVEQVEKEQEKSE